MVLKGDRPGRLKYQQPLFLKYDEEGEEGEGGSSRNILQVCNIFLYI